MYAIRSYYGGRIAFFGAPLDVPAVRVRVRGGIGQMADEIVDAGRGVRHVEPRYRKRPRIGLENLPGSILDHYTVGVATHQGVQQGTKGSPLDLAVPPMQRRGEDLV